MREKLLLLFRGRVSSKEKLYAGTASKPFVVQFLDSIHGTAKSGEMMVVSLQPLEMKRGNSDFGLVALIASRFSPIEVESAAKLTRG